MDQAYWERAHSRERKTESGERSKLGVAEGPWDLPRSETPGRRDGAGCRRDEITHAASGITTL